MTRMTRMFVTLGATALLFAGCAKSEPAPETTEPPAEMEKAPEPEPMDPEPMAAADESADYVKIYAMHEPATDTDPVIIAVEKFAVTKAEFDPANIEGGMAEIEIDLTSIKSDKEKRDAHLQTADYLDTPKFAKATVKIHDIKKGAGETYSGQAEIMYREMNKTFPVEFEVVETMDDAVRVKGMHEFSRMDFGVGKEPDGDTEKVAKNIKVEMQLTLKKS